MLIRLAALALVACVGGQSGAEPDLPSDIKRGSPTGTAGSGAAGASLGGGAAASTGGESGNAGATGDDGSAGHDG